MAQGIEGLGIEGFKGEPRRQACVFPLDNAPPETRQLSLQSEGIPEAHHCSLGADLLLI